MTKLYLWLLGFAMLIAIAGAPATGYAAAGEGNLLLNPSFEQTGSGAADDWSVVSWNAEPGASVFGVASGAARTGRSAGRIENVLGNDARYAQNVEVSDNQAYRISGWIRTEEVGEDHKGASLSVEGKLETSADVRGTSDSWEYVELYAYVQPGVRSMKVTAGIGGYGDTNTGTAYFDDIRVEAVDAIPDGATVALLGEGPAPAAKSGQAAAAGGYSRGPGAFLYIALAAAFAIACFAAYRLIVRRSNASLAADVPAPSTRHIDALDGLRGIAILLVMWFHVWQLSWLPHTFKLFGREIDLDFIPVTGFVGVDLFFFISAFCLCLPYARHMTEGRPMPTLKHFFYRRAIKILPSYYLAIALVFLFAPPAFPEGRSALWHLITHLLFVHDWFLDTKNSIVGVFWSLGVEVQFYLLFPVLMFFFRRKPLLTGAAMTGIAVGYRLYHEHYSPERFDFLIDHLPGFLDVFACGMLAAYAYARLKGPLAESLRKPITAFSISMAAVALALMGWLYAIRYDEKGFAYWEADNRIWFALAFALLAVSACFSSRFWIKAVANRAFVFLSVISYNLYIWHQLIARKLVEWRWPPFSGADPHGDHAWQVSFTLVAMAVSILFAAAITYGFERPLLARGVRATWRSLAGLAGRSAKSEDKAA